MTQLDIAGCTTTQTGHPNAPHHYLAEVCRSVRVHQTSLAVDNNEHIYGPPFGQLLIVAEEYVDPQDEHATEVDASIAIDSLARQLLRDDSWLMSLTHESWLELETDLKAVLKEAPSVVDVDPSTKLGSDGSGCEPRFSLTAAFIAWPRVTIVQVGNSTAYLCRSGGAVPLTDLHNLQQHVSEAERQSPQSPGILPFRQTYSESQPTTKNVRINGWHGELDTADVLVLGTSAIPHHLTATEIAKFACSEQGAAKICAEQIEQSVRNVSHDIASSVVVAKLKPARRDTSFASARADSELDRSTHTDKVSSQPRPAKIAVVPQTIAIVNLALPATSPTWQPGR